MAAGGKAAHVGPDLGKDRSRCQRLDAGGGHYLFDGGAKGGNGGLQLLVDSGNGGIEGVDLIEMQPQQQTVLRRHATSVPLNSLEASSLPAPPSRRSPFLRFSWR